MNSIDSKIKQLNDEIKAGMRKYNEVFEQIARLEDEKDEITVYLQGKRNKLYALKRVQEILED